MPRSGTALLLVVLHGRSCSTYDFGRVRLRNMASALAPGLLRIGGTEADRVFYALDEPSLALAESQPPPPFKSVLKAARIDAIG